MYELPKRVYKFTFFQAKRRRCLSSSSIFGAGSLNVVPSTIIQMVSRVFKSHAFAGRSYFGTKLQILLIPCLHEVCTAFFLFKAFQYLLVTYLHTVVLEILIL